MYVKVTVAGVVLADIAVEKTATEDCDTLCSGKLQQRIKTNCCPASFNKG
jgi:hypothetical protein